MNDESSDAFKIRRAPSGKFYIWGNGEAICLPNGSLRYVETERDDTARRTTRYRIDTTAERERRRN
jgi:hypothetical protein